MVGRKREGALTANEKQVVKVLVVKGWRDRDIQALVNSARITEAKNDPAAVTISRRTNRRAGQPDPYRRHALVGLGPGRGDLLGTGAGDSKRLV